MLSGRFENCYGIKKFELKEIDFAKCNKAIIYAPNGVMKTSFSSVFDNISKGIETTDRIFKDQRSYYNVQYYSSNYTNDKLEPTDNIYVVKSFDEKFELTKETIGTLLSDESTRKKYEMLVSKFSGELIEFTNNISKLSGISSKNIDGYLKNDLKLGTVSDWPDIFVGLKKYFDDVEHIDVLTGIKYTDLFNEKTEMVFKDENFTKLINEYVELLNDLISNNEILSKEFNDYNAEELSKALSKHNLFANKHKIVLSNGQEIESIEKWNDIINEQLEQIYSTPEIGKQLKALNKKLSGNESVRVLKDILMSRKELIVYLKDIEQFKINLWINYLNNLEKGFFSYFDKVGNYANEIKLLYEKAEEQAERWNDIVKEFNRRFKVPFEVKISNKANFLLKDEAPNLYFTYTQNKDATEKKSVDIGKDELMKSLSMGERRAMYLLYILFDIEIIKEKAVNGSGKYLIIVDDIADSFDYKNKYAIIEYLYDISRNEHIDLLILTHNYDFNRTTSNRLGISYENNYIVEKNESGDLNISELKYKKDYFSNVIISAIKKGDMNSDEQKIKLISSIPFYRNLTEYINMDKDKLTCLLHIKEQPCNTVELKFRKIWDLIPQNLKVGFEKEIILDGNPTYIDTLRKLSKKICNEKIETVNLENKILLSIAIRLELEMFLKPILINNNIDIEEKSDQTKKWIEKAEQYLNPEQLTLANEVSLMTSENIHLNSFMYEPIIDMSDWALKDLYKRTALLNDIIV